MAGDLRPRHMVCPGASATSDRCRGCYHRAVHDERLNCKADKTLGCPGCEPVGEANQ